MPRVLPLVLLLSLPLAAQADETWWSLKPLSRPAPPQVKNKDWVRTPIDRFILAKQEEKGLVPNGPAAREKLLRRAYYDLLGLPPTPEEVEEFLATPPPTPTNG